MNPATLNATTLSPAVAERSLSSEGEMELRPIEQKASKPRLQIEADAERIKSAVGRLTANSIDGLEGLASELQQLQAFLKSEVERVQGEIESAMAGISIIIDTISPWKTISGPLAAPTNPRAFRAGPAANLESAQTRR
jgi:hypothetical protein